MEEVIRVREVRKSMEQSGHFFTPICSPMTATANSAASGGHFQFPSSTPRNFDLYMTLDCTPEEEPRRKKSNGSGGSKAVGSRNSPRTHLTRNKLHESVILDDTASSSVNSSTAGESSASATPDNMEKRITFKRKISISTWLVYDLQLKATLIFPVFYLGKYEKDVVMASFSTQTSPGVLKLPAIQGRRYALRSAQSPATTPGKVRSPPQVIQLSPDMFHDGSLWIVRYCVLRRLIFFFSPSEF